MRSGGIGYRICCPGPVQGEVVSTLAVIEDISDKKKLEENLRENEGSFREIFDHISDAVQIHEIDETGIYGKFIELNSVACEMLGFSREELLAKGPLDITTAHHSQPLSRIDMKACGNPRFETEHIRKDGRNHYGGSQHARRFHEKQTGSRIGGPRYF